MAVRAFNPSDPSFKQEQQTGKDKDATQQGDTEDIGKQGSINTSDGVDRKMWEIDGIELANPTTELMRHIEAAP